MSAGDFDDLLAKHKAFSPNWTGEIPAFGRIAELADPPVSRAITAHRTPPARAVKTINRVPHFVVFRGTSAPSSSAPPEILRPPFDANHPLARRAIYRLSPKSDTPTYTAVLQTVATHCKLMQIAARLAINTHSVSCKHFAGFL
jgi:hypothetical protein